MLRPFKEGGRLLRAARWCAAGLFCAAALSAAAAWAQETAPRSGVLESDLSKARTLQARGDWRNLQAHASRWARRDPKEWRAWRFLGEAEQELGRLPQAVAALRQAERARPPLRGGGRDDDDTLLVAVAELEERNGQLLDAENSYLLALQRKRGNTDTWRKLSDLRTRLAENDPLRRGKAEATLATVMALPVYVNDYERWRKLAELRDGLERFEDAKAAYEHALRLQPTDAGARERVVLIDLNAGRKDAALTGMRILLRVDPNNVVANAYLGEKQLAEGFVPEAKEHFRRVAAAGGGDPAARTTAYSHLIALAENAGEKLRLHREILRVDPTLWDSWDYVIVQTRRSNRDAAAELLRRKSSARLLTEQGRPVPAELLP